MHALSYVTLVVVESIKERCLQWIGVYELSYSQTVDALKYMVFVQHTICNIILQASMSVKSGLPDTEISVLYSCGGGSEVERLLLPWS